MSLLDWHLPFNTSISYLEMQNTSLCILNCVWIGICVSAFYLHCFRAFYNSHKYMLILKNNHQTPRIIFHFCFFIQCWVSSYKHFCGWAKSSCCSLRDLFFILPALWAKPLASARKGSCCRYRPLCQIPGYKQSMWCGKRRCNMIFKGYPRQNRHPVIWCVKLENRLDHQELTWKWGGKALKDIQTKHRKSRYQFFCLPPVLY